MSATEDYVPLLKELLRDGRVWVRAGIVTAPEGEERWEIIDGDVYVDVALSPGGEQVLCRLLAAGASGPGLGLFAVPDEGAEVIVAIPEGDVEADCSVIGVLGGGTAPDGLDGNGTVVIVAKSGAKVLIHDGTASGAKALVTKDDFNNHTHALPPLTSPSGPVTAVDPIPDPAPATISAEKPDPITGTTVLQAK